MEIKIFTSVHISIIEEDINGWLSENPKIVVIDKQFSTHFRPDSSNDTRYTIAVWFNQKLKKETKN